MLVGFHTFNSKDTCPICYESMDNGKEVIAHDGDAGEKHPWHSECIKAWMQINPTCPSCTIPLKTTNMVSAINQKIDEVDDFHLLQVRAIERFMRTLNSMFIEIFR